MRKSQFILILLIFVNTAIYGQNSFVISGIVQDTAGVGLSKATLMLFNSKDTLSKLSSESGSFIFLVEEPGTYTLLVTMKGYVNYNTLISITKDSRALHLPPIRLKNEFSLLASVTVIGTKPITFKEDTIEYHAAAYNVRPGSDLSGLLKHFPGMEQDTAGNMLVVGKEIGRIMINGQDFLGGNILTVLRNLPADIVDKVEVIDDYGDKARLTGVKSGESAKILNIVLKRQLKTGETGKLELGEGNKGRYLGTLFAEAFKEDRQLTIAGNLSNNSSEGNDYNKLLFLGYSNKWNSTWMVSGGFSLEGQDRSSETNLIQDNFYSSDKIHQNQTTQTSINSSNYTLPFTLKYNPSQNSFLRIYLSPGVHESTRVDSSSYSSLEQDSSFTKNTQGSSINKSNSTKKTFVGNLYFEKINPNSKSRYSSELSYQYSNDQTAGEDLSNSTIQTGDSINISHLHYFLGVSNVNQDLSGKFNYYVSLGKGSFLELGYLGRIVLIQNNKETKVPDSLDPKLVKVDSLSNNYTFYSTIHRFHIGYLIHSNKINFNTGLNLEPSSMSGNSAGKNNTPEYRYFAFLPHAEFSYNFNSENKLRLDYSTLSTSPTLSQLQPVPDLSNPQYPIEGNSGLKPSYTQSIKLNYDQTIIKSDRYQGFEIGLEYKSVQNMIIPNIIHPNDSGPVIAKTTFSNSDGFKFLKANYQIHLHPYFSNHFQITLSGSVGTNSAEALADSLKYPTSDFNWQQGLQLGFLIPDHIEVLLNGTYSHAVTTYATENSSPLISSSFIWVLNCRYYIFRKWISNYSARQLFTSGLTAGLSPSPALLNASIEKEFFKNNQMKLSLSVNDILNGSTGTNQVITNTSIVQSQTTLVGRYLMLTIVVKLERFK